MDKRDHLPARKQTHLPPNEEVVQAASEGELGFPSWEAPITVGIVNRTALCKTPCVEGGTHPDGPSAAGGCGSGGAGRAIRGAIQDCRQRKHCTFPDIEHLRYCSD